MKSIIISLLLAILLGLVKSNAWVYPEHRDIMLFAVSKLDDYYRIKLDELWAQARIGYEFRLTESVIDLQQLTKPEKIDYAAWPAIAVDHSCSAENMLFNILQSDWILKVADFTAQLKIDLTLSEDRIGRINGLRESDLRLQGADPEYATRAGSNNVHFLLSLSDVNLDAISYFLSCIKEDTELNAIGAYIIYHYTPLDKTIAWGRKIIDFAPTRPSRRSTRRWENRTKRMSARPAGGRGDASQSGHFGGARWVGHSCGG